MGNMKNVYVKNNNHYSHWNLRCWIITNLNTQTNDNTSFLMEKAGTLDANSENRFCENKSSNN